MDFTLNYFTLNYYFTFKLLLIWLLLYIKNVIMTNNEKNDYAAWLIVKIFSRRSLRSFIKNNASRFETSPAFLENVLNMKVERALYGIYTLY